MSFHQFYDDQHVRQSLKLNNVRNNSVGKFNSFNGDEEEYHSKSFYVQPDSHLDLLNHDSH
jgi:hypothetical protein